MADSEECYFSEHFSIIEQLKAPRPVGPHNAQSDGIDRLLPNGQGTRSERRTAAKAFQTAAAGSIQFVPQQAALDGPVKQYVTSRCLETYARHHIRVASQHKSGKSRKSPL